MAAMFGFDSMDEMLKFQEEQERLANERTLPSQSAIEDGGYWMRPVPEMGIVEFGRASTTEELDGFAADEAESGDFETEAARRAYQRIVRKGMRNSRERGYLFGRAYSVMDQDGVLGSTHVSAIWPTTEEIFERAKAVKFNVAADNNLLEALQRTMDEHANEKALAGKASSVDAPAQFEVVDDV